MKRRSLNPGDRTQRLAHKILGVLATLTGAFATAPSLAASNILSSSSSPFSHPRGGVDLAQAWIDYMFRGSILPENLAPYAAPMAAAAEGLRLALGLYSMGMLILAALLAFFHIASMVVETAHDGVVFGRRANQVWMPIRLVLAIGILVPVGSSLNAGQYLVIKMAESGSTLASNAWREVLHSGGEHLSSLITPRSPDVAHLAVTAVEMEACRLAYEQIYTPLETIPVIHMAGNIGSAVKTPADAFSVETWRYSNALNANVPLCGEFRFSGYRKPIFSASAPVDPIARMAEDLSNFAHSQTDDLLAQAHSLADRASPAFLDNSSSSTSDIRDDLATLEKTYRDHMESEQRSLAAASAGLGEQALDNSAETGWLAAAAYLPELVRLQESYSELMSHALPDAQAPVLAHPLVARQLLKDAIDGLPVLHMLDATEYEKLVDFYGQNGRAARRIHNWLFATQLSDRDYIPLAAADLHDRLNLATEPDEALSLFARATDQAALARGVWGEEPGSADAGYPFAQIPYGTFYNPFAALVEFGRRQIDLASTLAGLAGAGFGTTGAIGPALLTAGTGLLLLGGGLLLVFVVPLLPFLRFLMAALTWILALVEAVLAVPIVAIMHLTPHGEGLSGGLGRQSYVLWLGLIVRPLMTLVGFVAGLLFFAVALAFINAALGPFARLALPSNGGLLVLANTALVLLYDVLVYAAANASFKGIA
ncbi:MAG: DotA/TraY family protein, partial [Pseudomonadota bacterium]|nr:DotA/TraY family protein [Pseudomonadota bacterium]